MCLDINQSMDMDLVPELDNSISFNTRSNIHWVFAHCELLWYPSPMYPCKFYDLFFQDHDQLGVIKF